MSQSIPLQALLASAVLVFAGWLALGAAEERGKGLFNERDAAQKLLEEGNLAEAYEKFRAIAADPATPRNMIGQALRGAVDSLRQLERGDEADALIEDMVAAHPDN